MTPNPPPKLGGEPARTKSEQAGWFPCRYWQLREPPRPRLRSGTPPNLGGECPHSDSFTAPMTAGDVRITEKTPTRKLLPGIALCRHYQQLRQRRDCACGL